MRATFLANVEGRIVRALFMAVLELPAQELVNFMENVAQLSRPV